MNYDVEQQCRLACFLSQQYIAALQSLFFPADGFDKRTPDERFRASVGDVAWGKMIEYAASDLENQSRQFHSDATPEVYAELFPWSCLFGALRSAVTLIEPRLAEYAGWRGVPFHGIQHDTPAVVAAERCRDNLEVCGIEDCDDEAAEAAFNSAAFDLIEECRAEYHRFCVAVDAVDRAIERGEVVGKTSKAKPAKKGAKSPVSPESGGIGVQEQFVITGLPDGKGLRNHTVAFPINKAEFISLMGCSQSQFDRWRDTADLKSGKGTRYHRLDAVRLARSVYNNKENTDHYHDTAERILAVLEPQ